MMLFRAARGSCDLAPGDCSVFLVGGKRDGAQEFFFSFGGGFLSGKRPEWEERWGFKTVFVGFRVGGFLRQGLKEA